MTAQSYFVLTPAQRATAMGFNSDDAAIDPRIIDGASPGTGINTNPDAAGYAVGAAVTLAGNYVAAARIATDPDYLLYVPDMVAYLLTLPAALLESETIFLPVDEG